MLILAVDDDPDDRGLFLEAINRISPSIKCIEAGDGDEAYELLTNTMTVLPDMIFLDINMPVMDGKTCLKLLRGNDILREIPVVILSTNLTERDIRDLSNLNADFLVKPATFPKLVEALSAIFISGGFLR